jgi:hypothetical protein
MLGGPCLQPAIPLKLIALGGAMLKPTLGLVDSGADCSNFPAQWAKALGIDLDNDCDVSQGNTAGGLADQYVYEPGINAVIMGRKIHLNAVFRPMLPIIILGREDFFAEYKVSFDQRGPSFRVESYEPNGKI